MQALQTHSTKSLTDYLQPLVICAVNSCVQGGIFRTFKTRSKMPLIRCAPDLKTLSDPSVVVNQACSI